jgi:hypothetical protein
MKTALQRFGELQKEWVELGKKLDDKGRVRLPLQHQEWSVSPTADHVNVWQYRRFDGDERLWNEGLSKATLTHRGGKRGPGLKFVLWTVWDFEFFLQAVHVVAAHGLDTLAHFDADALAGADDEESDAIAHFGKEGRIKLKTHRTRERDSSITRAKKQAIWESQHKFECEVCGFDFAVRYGKYGAMFIECHHRMPLKNADNNAGQDTRPEDLALVCANCHRMLHRNEWPTVEDLKTILTLVAAAVQA